MQKGVVGRRLEVQCSRVSQYQGVLLLIVHPILMLKTAGPNNMTTGPWQTLRDRRENKCIWGDIRLATLCCPSHPNAKDCRPLTV